MDNNSNPEQVWIPLEAQQGRLATLVKLSQVKGNPDFLGWFNRLLHDNSIPLSFDYEYEISDQVMSEHSCREIGTVGELMDWCTNRTQLFMDQRLIRFHPHHLEVRNEVVGLVCNSTASQDEFFIPDSVKSVTALPDQAWDDELLKNLHNTTMSYKDSILYSCNIIAFICEPLF